MVTIAETYIHIKVDVEKEKLYELKAYLEYIAAVSAKEHFDFEVDIEILIEEGSIKGWLKAAGWLYAGIAAYGSFRSGIDYLVKDGRGFSDYVIERLHTDTDLPDNSFYRTERRLGTPGRIKRLYPKLDEASELFEVDYINSAQEELKTIQPSLSRILRDLDSPEDRQMFLETVPKSIIQNLPEPLPEPNKELSVSYAILRKDEIWSRNSETELLEKYQTPPRLPLLK